MNPIGSNQVSGANMPSSTDANVALQDGANPNQIGQALG